MAARQLRQQITWVIAVWHRLWNIMVVLVIYNAQRESPSSDDEIKNGHSRDTGNIENVHIYKNHLVLTFEFYVHIYKQRNVRKNEGKQKWTIYRFRDIGNFGHKTKSEDTKTKRY